MKELLYTLTNQLSRKIINLPDYQRFYLLKVSDLLYKEIIRYFTEELKSVPILANEKLNITETEYKILSIYIAGIGSIKIEQSEKEEFSIELLNKTT